MNGSHVRRTPAPRASRPPCGTRHSVTSIIDPSAAAGRTKCSAIPLLQRCRTSIASAATIRASPVASTPNHTRDWAACGEPPVSCSRYVRNSVTPAMKKTAGHLGENGETSGHAGQDQPAVARIIDEPEQGRDAESTEEEDVPRWQRCRIRWIAPHGREQRQAARRQRPRSAKNSSRAPAPSRPGARRALRVARAGRTEDLERRGVEVREPTGVHVDEVVMRHVTAQHTFGALCDRSLIVRHPAASEARPAICRNHERHDCSDDEAEAPVVGRALRHRGNRHDGRNAGPAPTRATKCSVRSNSSEAGQG